MFFNNPLPRAVQPRFQEGSSLRSSRDSDATSRQWRKNKTVSSQANDVGRVLAKMSQDINKIRQRKMPVFQQGTFVPPFSIYQAANNQSGADSWRTFQMRDGIISARSRFWDVGYSFPQTFIPNFEFPLLVIQDAQSVEGILSHIGYTGASITLDNAKDTLITGIDGQGNPVAFQQFLADKNFDGHGNIWFSVWAEIIDSVEPVGQLGNIGFYANLWARMFTADSFMGRPSDPFPAPEINVQSAVPEIIPIGLGLNFQNTTFKFLQFLSGSLTNRFPGYPQTDGNGQVMNFRGPWLDANNTSLAGQFFYPGDVVTFVDSNNKQHLYYNHQYQLVETDPTQTDWDIIA